MEAIRELEAAARLKDDKYVSYDTGVVYGRVGRPSEAAAAYERSIGIDKKFKRAFLGAGLAYHDAGDFAVAVERLGDYVRLADDESTIEAYKTLGISCFETGDLGCAEAYLKRAAFLGADGPDSADTDLRLGHVYMEMGRVDDATERYRASVRSYPPFEGSLKAVAEDFERSGRSDRAEAIYGILNSMMSTEGRTGGDTIDEKKHNQQGKGN